MRLTVRWTTAREQWWAPAGHLVAWDQIRLRRSPAAARRRRRRGAQPPMHWSNRPVLNLWRAATDNDGFKLMPELAQRLRVGGQALRRWQEAGVDRLPARRVGRPHAVGRRRQCRAHATGMSSMVPESLPDLPRVGVTFAVDPSLRATSLVRPRTARELPRPQPLGDARYLGVRARRVPVPRAAGVRAAHRLPVVRADRPERRRGPADRRRRAARRCTSRPRTTDPTTCSRPPRWASCSVAPELVVCIDVAHRGLGTASCGPTCSTGTGSVPAATSSPTASACALTDAPAQGRTTTPPPRDRRTRSRRGSHSANAPPARSSTSATAQPAKPAARHPCAEAARAGQRQLDDRVERRRRHLEVVAQADVALGHQTTEAAAVTALHRRPAASVRARSR